MPVSVPTTDDLKGLALEEFRKCFSGAKVTECLPPDSLNKHCEPKPMENPITLVSTRDLIEDEASIGANELVEFELIRETCPNSDIQIRGTVRLNVERHRDGQLPKARQAFLFLAKQIGGIGAVDWMLIKRDRDESKGPWDVLQLALLARIKVPCDEHITVDDRGIAWLTDTRLKVREVVAWSLDQKWSVWRIHQQYGGSVSLQSIHAAFTWFDKNREQILKELVEDEQFAKKMRSEQGQPPAVQRLLSNRK